MSNRRQKWTPVLPSAIALTDAQKHWNDGVEYDSILS